MATLSNRRDVDGLRAIAVVPVLLFHFGFEGFSGGFVGVDIFFVISGFLITRLVKSDVEEGRFSFSHFYERRARRLFPAYYVVAVASLAAAIVLLSSDNLRQAGGSVIFASTSLSNLFFWSQAGYFDSDALTKPLLHTWSLSVEEQFYMFWPALLLLAVPRLPAFAMMVLLVALSAASTIACEMIMPTYTTVAFYWPIFRVAEFGLGAAVVWLPQWRRPTNALAEILFVLSLALMLWPVFTYDENTRFPGLSALVPCAGAALAIYIGNVSRAAAVILANRLFVSVGLISYSLYLVHWPIAVFFEAYTFREPNMMEKLAMFSVSIALAASMYRFVEKPFRKPDPNRKLSAPAFGLVCALLTIALIVPAAAIWSASDDESLEDYAAVGTGTLQSAGAILGALGSFIVAPASAQEALIRTSTIEEDRGQLLLDYRCSNRKPICGDVVEGKVNVIIQGDSHGVDAYNVFATAFPEVNLIVLKSSSCPPAGRIPNAEKVELCMDLRVQWDDYIAAHPTLPVVLQARVLKEDGVSDYAAYIQALGIAGHRVIVMGMGPVYNRDPIDYYEANATEENPRPDMAPVRAEEMYDFDASLKAAALIANGRFIDRETFFCPDGECRDYTLAGDSLVNADKTHITLPAAKELAAYVAETYPDLFGQ